MYSLTLPVCLSLSPHSLSLSVSHSACLSLSLSLSPLSPSASVLKCCLGAIQSSTGCLSPVITPT